MPMFQENLGPPEAGQTDPNEFKAHVDPVPIPVQPPEGHRTLSRRVSEESIRTELCEGPIPDSPPKPATPGQAVSNAVSDRAELIERLKRGESPTWIPNRHLESLFHQHKPSNSPPRTPQLPTSPSLLPPANITPEKQDGGPDELVPETRLQEGLNIERPRSALHSGNFTPEESSPHISSSQDVVPQDGRTGFGSAATPWATSPPRDFGPFSFARGSGDYRREAFNPSGTSSLSSSLSSSFAYKAPTSPLVQSESNDDIDLALPLNSINIAANSPYSFRRHTHNFNFTQPSPHGRQVPVRREGVHHYQAHQPRRSLNSTPNFSFVGSSPQTPAYLRSRRPSFSSEASPLQHASMVGSYEESILRGRMSTNPSKPLDFMAQIGVLGLGKCKASLRCPSHVTLPFSAVFYSYASTSHGRMKTEDGPSPYVGQIDLENGLPTPDEGQRLKRKVQTRYSERRVADEGPCVADLPAGFSEDETRKSIKHKRRSKSPKAPPGGRYRIPEKGQLQIIIKNQNKTAVKLFLIPYDLAGMEPGSKTFIRQRSYSAGPIIENIPDAKDAGTEDRPILRYLVHLHICCPSKGRFYLYKSIRVVFANRVPDGKERLRNEITYPEPRFTPYKPVRVMHQTSGHGATLAAEQAFRRRSSGFSFAHLTQPFDGLDGIPSLSAAIPSISAYGSLTDGSGGNAPIEAIPYGPSRVNGSGGGGSSDNTDSTTAAQPAEDRMRGLEMTGLTANHMAKYDKLNKGDVGYGGNAFASSTIPGTAEGLLSKRLRSLGVQGYLSDDSTGDKM
ncbi:hypothetical protein B0T25DRAFT_202890 [Lasiosphaeria hispida]|uniref:Atos-like conserved domain-containing protein n=1 Tax=Lasiosphaeria hispida TaxID=260671 RepID=A0AAJ0ME51_9PEZI|nr:hypothetical protein B0T25DRAFT_202890 [Lasiosphaeria hispida]